MARKAGQKTPCSSCPKGSPDNEKLVTLSARNIALVRRYQQVRATAGACLSEQEKADGWLMQLLAICDREYRAFEADESLRKTLDIVKLIRGV